MTTPKEWDNVCRRCRVLITYAGTYFKEEWRWEIYNEHDELIATDICDVIGEAAIAAKYKLTDHVDATAGVVR
jgi:hypothetical protein